MSLRARLTRSAVAGLASATLVAGLGAASIAGATAASAAPSAAPAASAAAAPGVRLDSATVTKIQKRLNKLGFPKLSADGDFGDYTRNNLCMWREVFNKKLPNRERPTAFELKRILSVTDLPAPRDRMVTGLNVNTTCQAVFWVAERADGSRYYRGILRASTGSPTLYDGDKSTAPGDYRVQRYYSGWSNSTTYPMDGCPVGLNMKCGNMYKPIYFNGGDAFHGRSSRYLPIDSYPASHGCVRLSFDDIEMLWESGMASTYTRVKVYGKWQG